LTRLEKIKAKGTVKPRSSRPSSRPQVIRTRPGPSRPRPELFGLAIDIAFIATYQ